MHLKYSIVYLVFYLLSCYISGSAAECGENTYFPIFPHLNHSAHIIKHRHLRHQATGLSQSRQLRTLLHSYSRSRGRVSLMWTQGSQRRSPMATSP